MKPKIKTGKRVEIRDGVQYHERAVYVSEYGVEYFVYRGERCYLYSDERGVLKALFFNSVKYI